MSRRITIWTLEGCGRCEAVKAKLSGEGFEERALGAARSGQDPDAVDVMAQLAFQDREAPVVRIDGQFISPAEVLARAQA